jgi:hypothetical protein
MRPAYPRTILLFPTTGTDTIVRGYEPPVTGPRGGGR